MGERDSGQGFVIRGHHVLIGMIAFFGVVIAVNVVFVRMALNSYPGEEVEKSYLQGLNYNDVLDDRATARERGWRISLLESPASDQEGEAVRIRIVDADGTPLSHLMVTGSLHRPTTGQGGVSLTFYPTQDGQYVSNAISVGSGAWDLSLIASDEDGSTLEATTRLWIDADE